MRLSGCAESLDLDVFGVYFIWILPWPFTRATVGRVRRAAAGLGAIIEQEPLDDRANKQSCTEASLSHQGCCTQSQSLMHVQWDGGEEHDVNSPESEHQPAD